MNNATTQSHIVWLDVIRTVAMLMVIGVHCIDPFYISPTLGSLRLSFTALRSSFRYDDGTFTIAYTGTIFRCFL